MEASAEAVHLTRAAPARAGVAARLLPGLYPPPSREIDSAIRRVTLALLIVLSLLGAVLYLVLSRADDLFVPIVIAVAGSIGAATIPWHRYTRDAFAVVSIATVVWVAWMVVLTGGARSPHLPLSFLTVAICVLPLSRRLGTVFGVIAAATASLPILYQNVTGRDLAELTLRSLTLVIAAVFAAWLTDEVRLTIARASAHEEQLATEQELASELRRAQTVRQEYLSVLAHELRNPLNAINAAARVLAKDVAGTPPETTARGIASEAHHAIELLDGLTDVASLESGRMRLALRPIDLAQAVRETATPMPEGHRIAVRGADQPLWVLGDDRRLGQVIRNLVTNAAKYSPADEEIQVSLGISADRKNAIVQVRDKGPGIPPAERARLFQKFTRLSTAGGTRGSGLGLYISRGIVNDHGGEMWADWPAGGGSVFSFSVPLTGDRGRRAIS
ncbi:MAG TPA: ATP-binding protein [Candidatus Limnocylindria bacterium]|nr:ATP-binding protein [Candidatus Limnocylindria bacterium]